ncbi:MAG: hypothetical protein JXC31_01560 [Acholeplasmataceae bacterium]|nr:hypothetical protein [Acholeplasmataceae bacterium]
MKNQKIEEKMTFWKWLHKYRLKIVSIAFLVIVPIALILIMYVGSYTANKVVNFDAEVTPDTVEVKEFLDTDGIDAFSLNIVWSKLKYPILDPNTDELTGGYYEFDITYEAHENYVVKSVFVTPVLQTDWTSLRSLGTKRSLEIYHIFNIDFNYNLPTNPLLFVKVSEPHLYLKVEYILTTGGNDVPMTKYVEFSLKDLNPLNVIS